MQIKKLRENTGLSQAELAAKVGVTQGFISHIELGTREPTLRLARKLAAALGVSVVDLLEDKPARAVGE